MKQLFLFFILLLSGCFIQRTPEQAIELAKEKALSAQNQYLAVLQTDPQNHEIKKSLARLYAAQGKYTEALAVFERTDVSDDAAAMWYYAQTLEEKNLYPEAKKIYMKLSGTEYESKAKQRLSLLEASHSVLDPSLLQYIERRADLEKYPDADSVVMFSNENIEVFEDNTSLYTVHAMIKILNEKGRDKWAELHLGYDSTYQRVELEYARTITPDRKVFTAGEESIRDVTRYMNFPMYSNSRVLIVSLPQVESGCFIEYKAKIYKSKLINEKDTSVIYSFFESFPIQEASVTFALPQDRKSELTWINEEYLPSDAGASLTAPVINRTKGQVAYTYNFKDVPRLLPESNMPDTSFVNPAVVFSTFESWDSFYAWWKGLYSDKTELNEDMRLFIDDLLAGISDPAERARLVYEFCSQQVRYVGIEYGDAGFEPHKAAEVFFNRYGDCKDQAVLLVSLLKYAGLKAYPVLISTDEAYDLREDIVASYFNHAIAAVELDGELVFMDPTSSTAAFGVLPLGDQGRNVMVFYEDEYRIVKTPVQKVNEISVTMQIEIGSDFSASVRRRLDYKGFFASSYRYYYKNTPPTLIRDKILSKAREMASLSQLEEIEIHNIDDFSKDPVLEYRFSAPDFLSSSGQYRIIPVLSEGILGASYIDRDERKYPIDLSGLYKQSTEVTLALPDNLEVLYLPEELRIDTDWGELYINFSKIDNEIHFTEIFETKERFISEKEYYEFKSSLEKILQESKKQIILKIMNYER